MILDPNDASDRFPAFSPDGSKIVFQSTRGSTRSNLFVMNPDGFDVIQLTNNDDINDLGPVFSSDGSKIYFERFIEGALDIFVMDADGNNIQNITNSPGDDSAVATPIGNRISAPGSVRLDSAETTRVFAGRVPASAINLAPTSPTSSARVKTP